MSHFKRQIKIVTARNTWQKTCITNLEIEAGYMYYNVKVSSYKIYAGKPFGLKVSHASVTLYPDKTVVKGYIENIGDKEINNFQNFACYEKGFVGITDAYLFYVPENSKDVLYPRSATEFIVFTRFINSSFNIVKCIITGESREYALVDEKIITSNANESLKITFWLTVGILTAFSTIVLVIQGEVSNASNTDKHHHFDH